MTEQLAKYEIPAMGEIERAATAMVKSKFFADSSDINQAIVKIMAGQEIGIGPFASMNGIHVISGKPAYGANILAAKVKGSGRYDYRVITINETVCTLEFFQGKDAIGKSTFTIEDARKSGTKNIDKFPRNMLFARAMSNGIKWFCPDMLHGVTAYVPEEFGAVVDDNNNIVVDAETVVTVTAPPQPAKHAPAPDLDADFPPIPEAPAAPLRFEPEALRAHIAKLTKEYSNQGAVENQKKLCAAMLSAAVKDDDQRHVLQYFLTGHQSFKEMPDPAIRALLRWLEPAKDENGKYHPNAMSVREANAIPPFVQQNSAM